MRIIFFLSTLLVFFQANGQKVGYFLPKKIIYVSVPFTINEKKLYKVDPQTGLPDRNPDRFVTTVKVDGDIKIESKLYPDAYRTVDLKPLGKGGKSFNFDITFDEKGNGLLSTVNASQTPVTADIIKGTVNIVASIIKLGTSVFAFKDAEQPETMEVTTEQKIVETRAIEINSNNPVSVTISPSIFATGTVVPPSPSVEITISKIAQGTIQDQTDLTASGNDAALSLHYRIPAEHSIQVKINGNQLTKEQLVIDERILIPQTGVEAVLAIPILKKKKTIAIGFDASTGNLSKYGLKKESQISENTEAINNAIGTLTTELSNLRTTLDTKKEKEEEEKKKAAEESRNKDIKDELERLKLEKEKLDLLIERQRLLDEIAEMKKAQKEAKIKREKRK
jgi:hypothetical protein